MLKVSFFYFKGSHFNYPLITEKKVNSQVNCLGKCCRRLLENALRTSVLFMNEENEESLKDPLKESIKKSQNDSRIIMKEAS